MTETRDWVRIPSILEHTTLSVDHSEEEIMQKPQMCLVISVQSMKSLETEEERPPSACELTTHLNPETFDTGIMC